MAIAVYNSEVPELIAVFDNPTLLSKYLVIHNVKSKNTTLSGILMCIKNNGTIKASSTRLNMKLACRNATAKQIELLNGESHVLFVDYIPKVDFNLELSYSLPAPYRV